AMHLIADAADVEDHIILAIAVDQAFKFTDHGHGPAVRELPSPLRGGVGGGGLRVCASRLPPSPTLPRKGGGSKEAERVNSPAPCGVETSEARSLGWGVGVSHVPTPVMLP